MRTNINAWAGKRRGDRVRIRIRDTEDRAARELFAVVGTGYVPYDLDAIAADVAELLPADARVRVRYDRQRARIDAVLCNPHHFPDSTGAAGVGEAHRLALRITTADDGTGGFRLRWAAERIRCVNLTLLRGSRTVFSAIPRVMNSRRLARPSSGQACSSIGRAARCCMNCTATGPRQPAMLSKPLA